MKAPHGWHKALYEAPGQILALGTRRRRPGPARLKAPRGGPAAGLRPAGRALRGEAGSGSGAMWTALGTLSEPPGPRAASGRFWAATLGAAVGLFLLGFLIGTVRTHPPRVGRLSRPAPGASSRGRRLGAGLRSGRVGGKVWEGFQSPGAPCPR